MKAITRLTVDASEPIRTFVLTPSETYPEYAGMLLAHLNGKADATIEFNDGWENPAAVLANIDHLAEALAELRAHVAAHVPTEAPTEDVEAVPA